MKLGMLVRADNTGLGTLTWEAYKHLKPAKTILIDYTGIRDIRQFPERFGEITLAKGVPTPEQIDDFLKGLDVVFSAETPYSYHLLTRARDMGVKTIIQPMYEFNGWTTNSSLPRPDLFAVPTKWHYDDFPEPKIFLPVPIATEHFKPNLSESVKHILHVVGRPAANDRNGTRDFVDALFLVKNPLEVTISCQEPDYVAKMLLGRPQPPHLRVHVSGLNPENYWELYNGFDLMVLPRRYAGLSLPVNEALGAGLPVIMTDISPNNTWLPKDWLVPAEHDFDFKPSMRGPSVEVYKTDPQLIANKIDRFISDPKFYQEQVKKANILAKAHSWGTLLPLYLAEFQAILKHNGKDSL